MAWSSVQKQIAVRACKAAGISDEQRRDMILRHFAHAHLPDGRISSTAPKLDNADYEQFMAIVERHAGGKLMHFTEGYWQKCAADGLGRLRYRARRVAELLEAAGCLAPGGIGLAGWIEKRIASAATNRLEDLDYPGLMALIFGLEAYGRRKGIQLGRNGDDTPGMAERTERAELPI